MIKSRTTELPACYAMVHWGLEEVAGEEIQELGGEVKKTSRGIVVFRVPQIDRSLLKLKTVEDVFVLAWGTDELTYRARDLDSIRRWTDKEPDWPRLFQLHHAVRPRPTGKPTFHLVVQMIGEHGYRRIDARKALARGLAGKIPASWREVDENAALEIWLTIQGASAVCGVRLSDRSMRHRTYKLEHLPASLRPSVAAVLVRLADIRPGHTVLDPMCGGGTLLAETLLGMPRNFNLRLLGGDIDAHNVRAAQANLHTHDNVELKSWDARKLPLPDASVDRILCNPPFGKQLSTPTEIGPLYRQSLAEMNRVLKPKGRAVLIVADVRPLREAVEPLGWKQQRLVRLQILGQKASILAYSKPVHAQ